MSFVIHSLLDVFVELHFGRHFGLVKVLPTSKMERKSTVVTPWSRLFIYCSLSLKVIFNLSFAVLRIGIFRVDTNLCWSSTSCFLYLVHCLVLFVPFQKSACHDHPHAHRLPLSWRSGVAGYFVWVEPSTAVVVDRDCFKWIRAQAFGPWPLSAWDTHTWATYNGCLTSSSVSTILACLPLLIGPWSP